MRLTKKNVHTWYLDLKNVHTWCLDFKTLPKAQRTRGLSSGYQSNFFRSCNKFSNNSWSDFIFIISTKQQLQNLNQISAFRLNLNFRISTKRSFRISTKNNLHNFNQGSAAEYWLKFSFKISPELQLQNFDQSLCSKSEQKFSFMTKLKLQQTVANTICIIDISIIDYNNKFWDGIFTRQGLINQVY